MRDNGPEEFHFVLPKKVGIEINRGYVAFKMVPALGRSPEVLPFLSKSERQRGGRVSRVGQGPL